MSSSSWRAPARRERLRILALLLLLGLAAMEYTHLEYHRGIDPHAADARRAADRDHALFHCGSFAAAPIILSVPVEAVLMTPPARTVVASLGEDFQPSDPRAPPLFV